MQSYIIPRAFALSPFKEFFEDLVGFMYPKQKKAWYFSPLQEVS
jgi:hypothetical protein